ncbi:MAG: SUMF1/EgtB/PvdO family nonheme iron enzyme [Candidatus Krumholzibacteriia bacterium]
MRLAASLLMTGLLLAAGCAKDDTVVAVAYDGDPIDDLTVEVTTPSTATLRWTAPSAGGVSAASYRLRWRVGSLEAATWDDATAVEDLPEPTVPGDPEVQWVIDLPAGQTVAFAVRYTQGAGVSDLSNVVVVDLAAAPDAPAGCVYLPAATFTMGSATDELGRAADEGRHQVTFGRGFFLARHEVTQQEYADVTGLSPSYHEGLQKPVERVAFLDAIRYCNLLSARDGLAPAYVIAGEEVAWTVDAEGWRLPTEAEWEYACRAGSTTSLAGGELAVTGCELDYVLEQFGLYCGNDLDGDDEETGPFPVGRFRHNAWNLVDMHGNVLEWCWDWYAADLGSSAVVDPRGPATGFVRVLRGGAWSSPAEACRSARRSYLVPGNSNPAVGFRVARTAAW